MRTHPALLHPVVTMGRFSKWVIDYMTINPPLDDGHYYIIVAVDYFTKWDKAIPTFNNMVKIAAYFLFNHVITDLVYPKRSSQIMVSILGIPSWMNLRPS